MNRKAEGRKMSESNRVGFLKKSKKYAKGKEYITEEGTIKIINRYLENGEIMISYMLMDTGDIFYKTELAVNDMLYRYSKKAQELAREVVVPQEYKTTSEDFKALTAKYEAIIDKQQEIINILMEQLKRG